MTAHNWDAIKADYLAKAHPTLEALAKAHKVAPSYLRKMVAKKGWNKTLAKVEQKAEDRAVEMVVQSEAERIAEAKERHVRAAMLLQGKGIQRLQAEGTVLDTSAAIQALAKGIDIEQKTLGINRDQGQASPAPAPTGEIHVHGAAVILNENPGSREVFLDALEQSLDSSPAPVPRKRKVRRKVVRGSRPD